VLAFNRAGGCLLSNDWNGIWRLWDTHTGRQLLTQPASGTALHFRGDDALVAADLATPKVRLFHFRAGQEFATLAHPRSGGPADLGGVLGVVGAGRLLAVHGSAGIVLVDRVRQEEVALLPVPGNRPLWFDPDGRALWTHGQAGVLRWPLRTASTSGSDKCWLGPPQRLSPSTALSTWGSTPDLNLIAIPNYGKGALLWRRGERRSIALTPQPDVRSCAVSPDGRWVATGSHGLREGAGAKVWDAHSGRHIVDLPAGSGCNVGFSPDGRWLLTTGGRFRLWEVGTWREGPALGGPGSPWAFAFTADGKLLALEDAPAVVRLVEPDTGREVARLTAPEQARLAPQFFTPDGCELVAQGTETRHIHIFDLRALRRGLRELGLDWDAPAYPEAGQSLTTPLEIQVVGAELVNPKKLAAYERAGAAFELYVNPFDADARCRLGGHLLNAGQPAAAYAHLSLALALKPTDDTARGSRAVAAFRLGKWRETVADATAVLANQPKQPLMLFYRGQALQKLGRHAEAIADFTGLLSDYPEDEQLYVLRADSYAALGEPARAEDDRKQAQELVPSDPLRLNNLAWQLVSGPPERRNPARALQLAKKAVELAPANGLYLNTLGVVQYRNGQYREAIATLERSLIASKGESDAHDLFFLAMCHHRLGDAVRARDCFDRAVRWVDEHRRNVPPAWADELKEFRAEAEALLGKAGHR
jgi:tetratricopeptide (TPR) repeat protein/WD40 repeat protein